MNLPLARRLASEGLSLKDAAKRMGVPAFRLAIQAEKHGIPFAAATRRPSDWECPEEPEAKRQWHTGRAYSLRWNKGRDW